MGYRRVTLHYHRSLRVKPKGETMSNRPFKIGDRVVWNGTAKPENSYTFYGYEKTGTVASVVYGGAIIGVKFDRKAGSGLAPYTLNCYPEEIDHLKKALTAPMQKVLEHLHKVHTISVREAMDDYAMSGGHLTKIVSVLRQHGHPIKRHFRQHPITGKRYARYYLVPELAVAAE
jgi:hypothetical protein